MSSVRRPVAPLLVAVGVAIALVALYVQRVEQEPQRAPAEPAMRTGEEGAERNRSDLRAPASHTTNEAEAAPAVSAASAPETKVEVRSRIHGSVLDDSSAGASELPVFLLGERGGDPLETTTDLAGGFDFRDVPIGTWRIALGGPKYPIVPAREVQLDAAPRELEPFQLPRLGRVRVTVVDENGNIAPGVELHGHGEHGGEVRERTDALGTAIARFLPAGAVRIFASDPQLGRGNQVVDLAAGADETMTIALRRKP